MNISQLLLQIDNAIRSVSGTFMVWTLISILLNNGFPIVVVLSESMYPGFHRGDVLWLINRENLDVGEMAVFRFSNKEIPCVHRCIKHFDGRYLTKGDNNLVDDVWLYPGKRTYLLRKEIKSTVIGYIPGFGIITLLINKVPGAKFAILLLLALSVLVTREE